VFKYGSQHITGRDWAIEVLLLARYPRPPFPIGSIEMDEKGEFRLYIKSVSEENAFKHWMH